MADQEPLTERGRKEVDPQNIIEGGRRVVKPTERAKGNDYPKPVVPEKQSGKRKEAPETDTSKAGLGRDESLLQEPQPKKKKSVSSVAEKVGAASRKALKTIGELSELGNLATEPYAVNTTTPSTARRFSTPPSAPMGEAVNEDGTLKDASEIEWYHSPSSKQPMAQPRQPATASTESLDTRPTAEESAIEHKGDQGTLKSFFTFRSGRSSTAASRRSPSAHSSNEYRPDSDDDIEMQSINSHGVRSEGGESDEEEDEADGNETESSLSSDEGTRRYQKVLQKLGKKKPKKTHLTRDVRLFFKQDTHVIDGKETPGWFCRECRKDETIPARRAFFLGKVSTQRMHISRFHYDLFLERCEQNQINSSKVKKPSGWKPKNERPKTKAQQSIAVFTQKQQNTAKPKVTKRGLLQHIVELVVDADLSFRFVERPSFRRLVLYLNGKLNDSDIPHKTSVADEIAAKGEELDVIDFEIIQNIRSRITLVYDGWSTKNRRNYTGIGIQYIDSPEDNENDWRIRRCLLFFEPSPGRHTGKAIGRELLGLVRKFHFENKLGWTVGDNLQANDVAVRYLCRKLNNEGRATKLVAKEMRARCISHAIHLGPSHFVKALNVPGVTAAKKRVHAANKDGSDDSDDEELGPGEEYDEDFDVDMSMDVEANAQSATEVLSTQVVDFEAGDVIGKLLAFINQIRGCSESARDYFEECCILLKKAPRRLKLWVRTQWGSLSDCFETAVDLRDVIDHFCRNADFKRSIPKLRNGKRWTHYMFREDEWEIIELSYKVLKVAANMHAQLSADRTPTLHHVYPVLESLMTQWENMVSDAKFSPIKHAIEAGLANLVKWYKQTDETPIYFIAHLLDPVRKDRYVKAAWDEKYVDAGMLHFRRVFSEYKADYDVERRAASKKAAELNSRQQNKRPHSRNEDVDMSRADAWMDQVVESADISNENDTDDGFYQDPFEELNRYFAKRTVSRKDCPDPVSWWGHQGSDFPVLRRMARDYLAIPASSALIERAFSMSARTDDPRRRKMGKVKFGLIQRLRDAYREGRLDAVREAWVELEPDFDFYDDFDDIIEILED